MSSIFPCQAVVNHTAQQSQSKIPYKVTITIQYCTHHTGHCNTSTAPYLPYCNVVLSPYLKVERKTIIITMITMITTTTTTTTTIKTTKY